MANHNPLYLLELDGNNSTEEWHLVKTKKKLQQIVLVFSRSVVSVRCVF